MRLEDVDERKVPEFLLDRLQDKGIEDLNPPQEQALDKGVLEDRSMIVSSPTASGKTLIATLGMGHTLKEGGKAIYLVPLKALASEKYNDYKELFEGSDYRVSMSVGDRDSSGKGLSSKDLIIMTVEKLDSILRHNPTWIKDVDMVVVDEIHLLNSESRGPTLEVTLTRLRELMNFQLLGLSATISNSGELADWLDAELVESNYRPVKLKKGIYWQDSISFYPGDIEDPSELEENSQGESQETSGMEFRTGSDLLDEDQPAETEELPIQNKHSRSTLNLLDDTFSGENQAIMFVRSRKSAESEAEKSTDVSKDFLDREEKKELKDLADRVKNVLGSPTEQCKRLANCVRKGTAFHHAGLCVTGDTQIIMADGSIRRIDEFVDDPDDKVMGLKNNEIAPVDLEDTFKMGEKPVLEIETRTGNSIKISLNHPLPVLGEEGIVWKEAQRLEEGDHVARPRNIDIEADPVEFRELIPGTANTYRKYEKTKKLAKGISRQKLADLSYRSRYGEDRNIAVGDFRELCAEYGEDPNPYLDKVMSVGGQKLVKVPKNLNEDLCWLFGVIAGDGSIYKSSVRVGNNSSVLIEEFRGIVKEQFDREVQINERGDGLYNLRFSCKVLVDLLDSCMGIHRGDKLGKLQLPKVELTDNLLASYLSGLFDTDGSISPRKNKSGAPCIEYYSSNERFITQIKMALLRFGILAYKDRREVDGRVTEINGREVKTRGDIHRLSIYGADQLREFMEKINFRHPEKKRSLERAVSINPEGGRGQLDVVPTGLGRYIREIREKNNLSFSDIEPEVPKATLSRYERSKTPIKRTTFQRLALKLGDELLREIANAEIYWDKIESIEEVGRAELYDLSTESDNYIANGFIAHNTSEQRSLIEEGFRQNNIKSISATPTLAAGVSLPAFRIIIRDVKRYTNSGLDYIPTLEYEQMSGRAGRPEHHSEGQAIAVAKNQGMKEEILERYIMGQSEKIWSKLAVEPVLRMHTLSLIATGFVTDMDQLESFFSKTFYAHQYGDLSELNEKLKGVVKKLADYGFLEEDNGFDATRLGERVAELYIDPYSAHHMLQAIEQNRGSIPDLGLLQTISETVEMKPLLRVKEDEVSDLEEVLEDSREKILSEIPEPWDNYRYESFLESFKTALMLKAWISEKDEDWMMNRFNVTPGGIRAKVESCDWLLYACEEMCRLKDWEEEMKAASKLRTRVKHGIEEDLVRLVRFKGVGRVRARRLFDYGVEDVSDIREIGFTRLKKMVGDRTARRLKEEVGEENLFDKENVLDYFKDKE